MACAVDSVKLNIDNLLYEYEDRTTPEFDAKLLSIFTDGPIKNITCCSCLQQQGAHQPVFTASPNYISIDPTLMRNSRRLFATCIVSGGQHLIPKLLRNSYDDSKFKSATTEEDIVRDAKVDKFDAETLLMAKDLFFGINLTRYLRSTRTRDRPHNDERNWLINEVLELMRKLARGSSIRERKFSSARITNLVIRTSDAVALDRTMSRLPTIQEDAMSMQSLGFLVLDVLWFIYGGGSAVAAFDAHRDKSLVNIRRTSAPCFDLEHDLSMAFEMVWVMLQPGGRSYLKPAAEGGENYQYPYNVFRTIWPTSVLHTFLTEDLSHSFNRGSTSTSPSSNLSGSHFEEVLEAQDFRWLILLYQKDQKDERSWTGCRMRIFRSLDGKRLRFDIYDNPVKSFSRYFVIADFRFVPLYAHADRSIQFGMKLQPKAGSARYTDSDLNFKFHSEEDVIKYQEVLTGRRIMKDLPLQGFSIDIRKSMRSALVTIFSSGSKSGDTKWRARGKDIGGKSSGRTQIWEVMSTDDLKGDNEVAETNGRVRKYRLRFELAMYSDNALIVVGVKSLTIRKDQGSCGLVITSKDGSESSSFEGLLYKATGVDDEVLYPGLRLFQDHPFAPPHADRVFLLDEVHLIFESPEDRSDFEGYISRMERFRKTKNGPPEGFKC